MRDEKGQLAASVEVTVRYVDSSGKNHAEKRQFNFKGSPTYINSWLENRDDFMKLRFEEAYQTLAENIVMELSAR